jgi:hypothetical protein
MVHAAVVALLLTGSFAEDDVYYHTQLLQTKVNPQKVSVDTTGNVQDDMALFQKSFSTTLHRKSKEVAHAKFYETMKRLKGGPKRGGKKGGDKEGEAPPPSDQPFGPPPPEAAEQCATYYGGGVDVNKCWSCSMQAFMSDDGSGWHPDPNVGMKQMLDSIDGCMGERNHLTGKCQEYYGEEVGLMDCMVCGMMCECESPQACDMDCHQGCMSFDESHYEEEEHHNDEGCGLEECKMFYGDDVSEDKCKECGEKCFEEAMANAESEEAFFNTLVSCSDACMGAKNEVSQQCEAGYGPDVDVYACFNCGMMCGCDHEQCDHECHGGCMEGGAPTYGTSSWSDWDSSSWSDSDWDPSSWSSSWPSTGSSSWASTMSTYANMGALLQASQSGKVKNLKFSTAMRLYAKSVQMRSKAKTDTTDLMQTSKHLK